MSRKKDNAKNDQNKAEEPDVAYDKKRIVFFDSLEQMNKHDHRYYASLTPEERLQTVLEMRNAIWPDQPESEPFGTRLYFKR